MDERTVYLYARHNGFSDRDSASFATWYSNNGWDEFPIQTAMDLWMSLEVR